MSETFFKKGDLKMANAYKEAGVNIEAGYQAVERMKRHVKKTERLRSYGRTWRLWGNV